MTMKDVNHSFSLDTDSCPHTPTPHIPPQAIFSIALGTENLERPPRKTKSLDIIPIFCTCLTITLILISEQPTNTS